MTDCCGLPSTVGVWHIYVKTPTYYPNRVKYNWNDGTGEQVIEANDYNITQQSVIPDGISVNVSLRFRTINRNGVIGNYQNRNYNVISPVGNLIVVNETTTQSGILRLYYGVGFTNYVSIANFFNLAKFYDYEILNITRNDGQSSYNYTLTITNNSNVVYTDTRSTNPTAVFIPEYCLQAEQKVYVRDYQNSKPNDYCGSTIQGNQTTFLLYSQQLNGTYIPVVLAYQSSDERCSIAPIFEVECIPCKSCPQGTCEVICGDSVCCYGSDGIAVDSFLLSELC